MGKQIIIARNLTKEENKEIRMEINRSGAQCIYAKSNFNEIYFDNEKSLLGIDTPVVFVMGSSQQSDKFEIQLALREELLKLGYHVSQIGSRSFCELLGFHSMPSFMIDHTVDESDKIRHFNHFVKEIERRENPELIIIGIPGGALPFSDKLKNDFGITAFEISQALTPDYVVCSSLYEDYSEAYFAMLSRGIENKLGYAIDSHVLSVSKVDWISSESIKEMDFLPLSADVVERKTAELNSVDNLYNIYGSGGARIAEDVVKKLSKYAYVKSV